VRVELQHTVKRIKRTDWEKVREWVEKKEECNVRVVGEAYEMLKKKLDQEWTRVVTIVGKSKPWWKAEWKQLRREARKSKEARRRLRREIRAAKSKMWNDWLEEGKEVWDIVRTCKNPFNNRARCGTLRDNGQEYETDAEKFQAFQEHNLITEPAEARSEVGEQPRRRMKEVDILRVTTALRNTKNGSVPGPDRISWKLLKAIKETELGRAIIEDVAQVALAEATRMPEEWRNMKMVMLPKPGKDHTRVKGWKPIVLANTVGKLAEKIVAQRLQEREELWHERAFAGRKGRGAIDSVMLMAMLMEENKAGEIIGRDAQSAFNTLRRDHTKTILEKEGWLGEWIDDWLAPREFDVEVDGRWIGRTTMTGGTPQGSPLSPALFTIYMSSVVWAAEKQLKERKHMTLRNPKRERYWPLSFIDDVNGVCVGSVKEVDAALQSAAEEAGIRWDREKNWSGKGGKHLGVIMGDQRRHQKYRAQKARAAWEMVKGLGRLSAVGKRRIITQQILPILTYGCELYPEASEEQKRLARECQRWVVGAYRGSDSEKVESLTGIGELGRMMMCKRIRWAASVYGRHMPELRRVAEPILREWIEEDAELRWMKGSKTGARRVEVTELEEERVEEWTDGSRIEGRAAAATRTKAEYLGEMATVADAEELGVSLAWEEHDVVALDSKGVIQRIQGLTYKQPRSWIEERLVQQMAERPRELMWVKGHDGTEGNEMADMRAKREVRRGRRMHKPDVATPAGIRQAYRIHGKTPAHLSWSRWAIRGLTYMVTDKGPQAQWLKTVGKVEDASCVCDGRTPQNAAHLYECPWVGDGRGRTREMIMEDEKWCEEVARFLL